MNLFTSSSKIIIPAAGFGRRVGQPEAKEMFIDPSTGRPLIDRALRLAADLNVGATVITRPEKKSLLEELNRRQQEGAKLDVVLVKESQEWPDSILLSEANWADKNIVLLPDTIWEPTDIVERLFRQLDQQPVTYAVFDVGAALSFGFVQARSTELLICEKPRQPLASFAAWGIFGFRREMGRALLQAHLTSTCDHEIKSLKIAASILKLQKFADLTRGNEI